jgi:DnaJ-class molecular chaperone
MRTTTCPRCNGNKILARYAAIKSGVCFRCNGRGTVNATPARKVTAPDDSARQNRLAAKQATAEATYGELYRRARAASTTTHPLRAVAAELVDVLQSGRPSREYLARATARLTEIEAA